MVVFPLLVNNTPLPKLSLSAAGLVALADLQTIAHRTALTGTSSWFDGLVLAPGLHYQQAADDVGVAAAAEAGVAHAGARSTGQDGERWGGLFGAEAIPDDGGGGGGGMTRSKHVRITNPGMLLLLSRLRVRDHWERERETMMKKKKRVRVKVRRTRKRTPDEIEAFGDGGAGKEDEKEEEERAEEEEMKVIFVDVGTQGTLKRRTRKVGRWRSRAFDHADDDDRDEWPFERGSHLLYLASPLLTATAVTMMVFLGDWWGLAAIIALITSRLLNIYIIKQRTPAPAPIPSKTNNINTINTINSNNNNINNNSNDNTYNNTISEYTIPLSPNLTVRLRGPPPDLAALTTDPWLLAKTAVQGYLEAAAKLAVYMVAVFSGNVSQAGNIVLLVLLLGSAALLGLSNGFVKSVRGRGRVARVY